MEFRLSLRDIIIKQSLEVIHQNPSSGMTQTTEIYYYEIFSFKLSPELCVIEYFQAGVKRKSVFSLINLTSEGEND